MPLPEPACAREPIHTRTIVCQGYRRADGLWDIEGHITDTKSYSYPSPERGRVEAGEPVHDMWLRLTVDDSLTVQAITARTESSPYPRVCPTIAEAYQQVVGLRIGPGWTRAIKERLGGVKGCTHLTELLGPLATVAFQTVIPYHSHKSREEHVGLPTGGDKAPFALLNTCHTFSASGPVIAKYMPHLATKADKAD